jgi:ferrous iron transport protein B
MAKDLPKIALIGNPNAGKSSLFNQLTGLRQKVGNFPGVTVERKKGICKLNSITDAELIDLPGTYSLYPSSLDERIAVHALIDVNNEDHPDAVIYIADVTHLESHLLLLTQIIDLGFPTVVALSMNDIAEEQNIHCDAAALEQLLNVPVVKTNGRTGEGMEAVKSALSEILRLQHTRSVENTFYTLTVPEIEIAEKVKRIIPSENNYQALLLAHHINKITFLKQEQREKIQAELSKAGFRSLDLQLDEIMVRYNRFIPLLNQVLKKKYVNPATITDKIDAVVTHKVFGPLIFFGLMFLVFQAIFAWAVLPMDWIDQQFANLATYLQDLLPVNLLSRLLTEGLIPGISGILVFVPQITILFFLITLLEEVGYMARAVFMFDNIMQRFGLNGRSIVSLISGGACAIPAIMSTRTINNWKERLITIMVTPLISCSARIPVFAVLIGFIIPSFKIGYFNSQGIIFMVLYLAGVVAALTAALVFKKIIKSGEASFLMLELPEYRMPHWKNVFFTLYEKVSAFVFGAGKIILIVSMVLWFLASFGPGNKMQEAEQLAQPESVQLKADKQTEKMQIAAKKLEFSYAGFIGRLIEPVIAPLGFDWKIGIALITSFAAREVFVGTISTLYSIGKDANNLTIRQKLSMEKKPNGEPVFTMPVALSLVLFYLFAMQCMSTLATVYRETKSWKWPAIQFAYMTGTAYVVSFLVYQLLS